MKPLFSKSFWCVLAIALLTSFSAGAGDMEDKLEDLYKDKKLADKVKNGSDFNTVSQFCMDNGNYKSMKDYFKEKDGDSFLFIGKANCFPAALADSIAGTQKQHSIVTGWTNEKIKFRWWKGIFDTLSDAVVNITNQTWDKVADSTVKLLAAAFALWIAMTTLPMVGSFKEQNPADYLQKVGGKAFKVMVAVLLLQDKTFFFDYIVSPIMEIAAGFAGVAAGGGSGVESVVTPLKQMMEEMHKQLAELNAIAAVMRSIGWSVDAVLFGFQISILGIFDVNFLIRMFNLLNIWVLISGCIIWIGALVLSIFFPFRVFDVVFRFGIILAIAPLYIAAWCFDITKDFAVKGFNAILHVAFTFMFLKITLDLCILLIIGAAGLEEVYALVQSGGSAYQIGTAIIKAYLDSGSAITQILTIIIAIVFCCMCLTKADELAGQFAQFSATSNAAERMGGSVVQHAQKAVNSAVKEGRDAFLENHVDGKAEKWATSGNSLKSALGRSYLRHRGADRNELKDARNAHLEAKKSQKADKANKKGEKAAEKDLKKQQKQANKQQKQHKKEVNKDALMNHGAERKALAKQIRGEELSEDEQKSIDTLQKEKPEVFESVQKSAQKEAFNPAKAKANDVAGGALRAQQAVKDNANFVKGKVQANANFVKGKINDKVVDPVKRNAAFVKGKVQANANFVKGKINDKVVDPVKRNAEFVKGKVQANANFVKDKIEKSAPVTAVKGQIQNAKDYREQRNELVNAQKEVSKNSGDAGAQERLAKAREAIDNNKNAPKFMKNLTKNLARVQGNKLARKENKD